MHWYAIAFARAPQRRTACATQPERADASQNRGTTIHPATGQNPSAQTAPGLKRQPARAHRRPLPVPLRREPGCRPPAAPILASPLFGPIIYSYTRAEAILDGFQIAVTKTAQEAGIRFPVFITRGVFDACVAVPAGVTGQDEPGRLWDVLWMLRHAILRSRPGQSRIPVALYVRNNDRKASLTKLIATAGALDMDDPSPAITIMLPHED